MNGRRNKERREIEKGGEKEEEEESSEDGLGFYDERIGGAGREKRCYKEKR